MTQRRYEGPTVIYLGGGYALTARHVGMGEIELLGVMYAPVIGSGRTLLNVNGTAADGMVFALNPSVELPELPNLPIASTPPLPGEDVLLIGFGRGRGKVIEYDLGAGTEFGFTWSGKGRKRWGTNRVESGFDVLNQASFSTRAISFRFDAPFVPGATRYEAQAAVGDSGGAVFVERDGTWELAAMMVSVSGDSRVPDASTTYGNFTFAADLTYYRDEIMRWTRPVCSNEVDDDGDERTDYPDDPGCDSPDDRSEWDGDPFYDESLWLAAFATFAIGCVLALAVQVALRRQRGTSTPSSTSDSNEDQS